MSDAPRGTLPASLRAYLELTKPGIAGYVVLVTSASFYLASRGPRELGLLAFTALATALATAGSLALNQYLEREVDGRMSRTRTRPLPTGRLTPRAALIFALALFLGGVGLLWLGAGPLPALLTLGAGLAYNFVYTPLKSRSYLATLAGAVPGAFPALIGWSSATGSLDLGAWVLFAIAYLWQMPHVLGLAWVLRNDYRLAGFRLAPPSDPQGRMIGLHMMLYAVALLPVSLLPTVIGLTGAIYMAGAFLLGAWLIALSIRAWRAMTDDSARRVFLGSLIYQPLLLALLLIDTVRL